MTIFEYISVIISILLSLGIAHLLSRLPDVFDRQRSYWIHASWVVVLLGLLPGHWWMFWNYRDVSWTAFSFLYAIASPGILFLLVSVLVPRESDEVDSWRDFFFGVRSSFFGLQIVFFLHISGQLTVILGLPLLHPLRALHALFIGLAALGAYSASERTHAVLLASWLLAALVAGGWLLAGPASLPGL
jgi:hypothetical protein